MLNIARLLLVYSIDSFLLSLGKNNLVWASYILFNRRPELNQEYSLDIELPLKKRFNQIPYWVYDKHVSGGNKGYQFFFDNS